jgi:prophage antirepressor-like protein
MPSTAIQATTSLTFRVSGTKPSLVHVFARDGRKWIGASEVCRILGLRTDTVPKWVPEQDRSHATVLTKGSIQSVTTITEVGFNLLVAQSPKPIAKTLHEWMVKEVLPSIVKAPPSRVPKGQGELLSRRRQGMKSELGRVRADRFGLSVIFVQKVPLRKSNEISNLIMGRHDYTID